MRSTKGSPDGSDVPGARGGIPVSTGSCAKGGRSPRMTRRGWRATFYTTGMEYSPTPATGTGWERTVARDAAGGVRGVENRRVLSEEGLGAILPSVRHFRGGAPTMERQERSCPNCSRTISPDDTIVFGDVRLGHLVFLRRRVLSTEERTLLLIFCRDHQVAECVRCAGRFHLQEVASRDSFGEEKRER